MKEKRDCKVVQDLLPNYVEKLTNEETNKYIEEHIETCEECKKVLDNMKKEIEMPDEEKQKKEVKFLKKYNRKIKILSGIILAIIIIYGIIVIRNTFILASMITKTRTVWNPNNMHSTAYSHSGKKLSIVDSYYLDDKQYFKIKSYDGEDITTMIGYTEGETQQVFVEKGENKVVMINERFGKSFVTPHMYFSTPFEMVLMAAISSITSTTCNGEECYFINAWGFKEYVNKKTGLTVRAMDGISTTSDGTFDGIVDYKYEFGTVKEEDFVLPDISEYQIIEQD